MDTSNDAIFEAGAIHLKQPIIFGISSLDFGDE